MTVKISNLPAATSVGSGDVIPVVQSGTTKKIDLNSPWNINIDGGNIDGTPIGVSSASSGAFTTLTATNNNNSATGPQFLNNDAGTSSRCVTKYSNGNNVHEFGIAGTNYAGYGVIGASTAHVYSTGNKNIALAADGNSNIVFGTGTGVPERMRIDSSGNVGIGVTNPSEKLSVAGNIATSTLFKTNRSNAAAATAGSSLELQIDGTTYAAIRQPAAETLAFYRGSGGTNETMRIDSSGRVGIGTTNPGYKLDVQGATSANFAGLIYAKNYPTSGSNVRVIVTDQDYSGDAIAFNFNGVSKGSISTDGNTTSYNTSSDYRLKENISDAEEAGAKVDAIKVRQFDWKADGSHQDYGMIAQELLTVAPEAVRGNPESDEMMGIDYSKLVPMLVKEIQSLRARVHALESQ